MNVLEKRLRSSKRSPLTFLGGILLAVVVFLSMGVTQLGIDFTPPEEPEPITEFHLPPPPPPPPAKVPPKKTQVSINFNLPATSGPADVPLGFLDVDFGLTPKKLTQNSVNVADTIEKFETDGIDDLAVYDYKDVTEKPSIRYRPGLTIPGKLIADTKKPVPFTYICRIDLNGRAHDIHIIDTPYPAAIPLIVEFVRGHRFKVAKKDGKPVQCIVRRKGTYIPSSNKSPFST
ncbi:hypothetical protein [Pelagicoccus sp. SDUM812002]|uniref:hypothetical protein n=1 Tax=Pelagicoccus sp. SDUM812002 TaxID=3041266 RepID=UPI00280D12D8|nr:hypothetical protein [Pelagicoccus sp. SDUM812002]MDQ8186342.1 hypothetical protein [Pelagicoccus sp. SDUM812002]